MHWEPYMFLLLAYYLEKFKTFQCQLDVFHC